MVSSVGRDRFCFVSLALLALLFMQGYSGEAVFAETSDVDQPARACRQLSHIIEAAI
jgi:hypothetical protein